ncbi:MAG: DUF72 domain-containing protein [Candidatus Omnitrophica bacterium]|nr:DUF72 domain-containing protein [Candidatus Omnitrophota bacterium]MCM8825891.1 DUF72 domain-containing protein [Candidatus Omnitrophota bacterium]
MVKRIFIGTSGYNYSHWQGLFYPLTIPTKQWLEFYTQHFKSVELNVTFYRLPSDKIFKSWYKRTPQDFGFVVKGPRFITHIKKLDDCIESLEIFFDRVQYLKEKLLCILWQLPPSLKYNFYRLENFVKLCKMKSNYLYSFEFRNKDWFNHEVFQLFRDNNISICIVDSPNFPYCEELTANFIYLRFHGGSILYGSNYSDEELIDWCKKINVWQDRIDTIFAFFNNDANGFAVKNALTFNNFITNAGL